MRVVPLNKVQRSGKGGDSVKSMHDMTLRNKLWVSEFLTRVINGTRKVLL